MYARRTSFWSAHINHVGLWGRNHWPIVVELAFVWVDYESTRKHYVKFSRVFTIAWQEAELMRN
jgi:hypothetical protein